MYKNFSFCITIFLVIFFHSTSSAQFYNVGVSFFLTDLDTVIIGDTARFQGYLVNTGYKPIKNNLTLSTATMAFTKFFGFPYTTDSSVHEFTFNQIDPGDSLLIDVPVDINSSRIGGGGGTKIIVIWPSKADNKVLNGLTGPGPNYVNPFLNFNTYSDFVYARDPIVAQRLSSIVVPNEDVLLHPNPARGFTRLSISQELFDNQKQLSIELLNQNGQMIQKSPIRQPEGFLITEGLAPGYYIVNIWADKALIETQKLIVSD